MLGFEKIIVKPYSNMIFPYFICRGPKPKPDGKPYQNGDPTKAGFGDDLSIPFIDDSPRPTPRVGRSTER